MRPDWSPDGSRLAFITDWTAIWTAKADGTDATQLIRCQAPCNWLDYPVWSPDGTQIAFFRTDAVDGFYTMNSIEVLDLATGSRRTVFETKLPDFVLYPRWSPDGMSLVLELQRIRPLPSYPVDGAYPEIGSVIAVLDISKPGLATPRILTDWDMLATFPDWSPAGDRIVFSTYDLGEWQMTDEASNLYTIRPDGTELTQVTHFGKGETRATQPTWTPDGQRIIFTQVGKHGFGGYDLPRQIAFIDPAGTNLEVMGIDATHPRLRPTP